MGRVLLLACITVASLAGLSVALDLDEEALSRYGSRRARRRGQDAPAVTTRPPGIRIHPPRPAVPIVDVQRGKTRSTPKAKSASRILLPPEHSAKGSPSGSPDDLVITEILASNKRAGRDASGGTPDWIELHNPTSRAIDLVGCTLTYDGVVPTTWTAPHSIVPPRGYTVIWLSGERSGSAGLDGLSTREGKFRANFVDRKDKWHYEVGTRQLAGPHHSWNQLESEQRFARTGRASFGYDDSDDVTEVPEDTKTVFIRRVFEITDLASTRGLTLQIDYDDGFIAYLNGTRVAAANAPSGEPTFTSIAPFKHEAGTAERFDLGPYRSLLRRGKNILAIAGFNNSPPGDPSSDMTLLPELGTIETYPHASFKLAREGGTVRLESPTGAPIDLVTYPGQKDSDRSYGRIVGARRPKRAPIRGDFIRGDWGWFLTPTPAAPNRFPKHDDLPSARLVFGSSGKSGSELTLKVEIPSDAISEERTRLVSAQATTSQEELAHKLTIRYTVDGSVPTEGSSRYSRPIRIRGGSVVRAAGFLKNERATPVVSKTVLADPPRGVRSLSLTLNPASFRTVHGDSDAHGRSSEREVYVEMREPDGALAFATSCGLRLHGGAGRQGALDIKKSYKLYFRGEYGVKNLRYRLFDGDDLDEFDKLVLRAGYNDRVRPRRGSYNKRAAYIRDQLIRDLHRGMGGLAGRGTWCTLYVNAEPRGLYNLVERQDERFLAARTGIKSWDVIKTSDDLLAGDMAAWTELRELVGRRDLAPDELHREIAERVDIEDFTTYIIVNTWAQNHDWPHNNWYAARPRIPGGRWRFLCWDAEWGIGLNPDGYRGETLEFAAKKGKTISDLLAALLKSPTYRAQFLAHAERHVAGPLRPENVLQHIDRLETEARAGIHEEFQLRSMRRRGESSRDAEKQWAKNVREMREFATHRGAFYLTHVRDYLGTLSSGRSVTTPGLPNELREQLINRGENGHRIRFAPPPPPGLPPERGEN